MTLLQGRDLVEPVERRVGRTHVRQPFHGAQCLELGEREVLGEPRVGSHDAVDRLRRPTTGELGMLPDVRRASDVVLVPRDQLAVLGGDEVRLDEVGAHLDGQRVGGDRVLGAVRRRAAMADHELRPATPRMMSTRPVRRRGSGDPEHRGRGTGAYEHRPA